MRKVERTAVGFYSLPVYKNVEGNLIQVGEKGIAFQYGTIGEDNTQEGIKMEDLLEMMLLRIEETGVASVEEDISVEEGILLTALNSISDLRAHSATPVEELPNKGNGARGIEGIDGSNEGSVIEPTKDDKSIGGKGFSLKGMFGLGGQTDNG